MKLSSAIKLAVVSLSLSGIASTSAIASEDGKKLYSEKLCMTCHGDEGKKPIISSYPKLNGQNKDYLIAQIKMIKDGTRTGGGTAAMKAMTTTLTDDQIKAISTYLSEVE